MSVSSRGRSSDLIQVPRKFKDTQTSPETTNLYVHPKSHRKAAVVYYLCRNGQLEHPHYMDVPFSSSQGLYLKDVINRLSILRGEGMASLYSWSSKRSYKNGFVWHDLADNDFIYPAHGNEYVLKGSELLIPSIDLTKQPLLPETASFERSLIPSGTHKSPSGFPVITRRRNQSWSSIDLNEYKVYKAEQFSDSSPKLAADAATQTDDKRRRRSPAKETEEIEEMQAEEDKIREEIEISPQPSDSSPETLESLMKAGGRLRLGSGNDNMITV